MHRTGIKTKSIFLSFFLPYSHIFLPTHCRSIGTRSRSMPHTHLVGCLSTHDQPIAALLDNNDGARRWIVKLVKAPIFLKQS